MKAFRLVQENRDHAQDRDSNTQIEPRQPLVHPILIPVEVSGLSNYRAGYLHGPTPDQQVEDGEVIWRLRRLRGMGREEGGVDRSCLRLVKLASGVAGSRYGEVGRAIAFQI